MTSPRTKGRMINRDISDSKRFAKLSPEAAVLFCMIIPHQNSHGKLNGDPGYIKAEICPRIPYLTYKNISKLLKEINDNTNMKWFEFDGRHWIHSINFLSEHQTLKVDRLGEDLLPTYSGVNQELVPPEVEEEVEDKEEEEGEGEIPHTGITPDGVNPESSKPKNGKFMKPTYEEVKQYCEVRENGIDPQAFIDKCESIGWVVGKNRTPMKDWQATIRTWEKNNKQTEGPYRHKEGPYR